MPLTGVRKSQPDIHFQKEIPDRTGIEGVFCQRWFLKKSKGQGQIFQITFSTRQFL